MKRGLLYLKNGDHKHRILSLQLASPMTILPQGKEDTQTSSGQKPMSSTFSCLLPVSPILGQEKALIFFNKNSNI